MFRERGMALVPRLLVTVFGPSYYVLPKKCPSPVNRTVVCGQRLETASTPSRSHNYAPVVCGSRRITTRCALAQPSVIESARSYSRTVCGGLYSAAKAPFLLQAGVQIGSRSTLNTVS